MSKAWPVTGIEPKASTAANARRILAVRSAEYFSYAATVPIEQAVEEHHNLRIAAKRLRYTLELFADVFGDAGKRQIARVKAIQEELGELHDHDVRIGIIGDQLKRNAGQRLDELSAVLASAPTADHAGLIAAALRPLPTDPQRGLTALLGREHARRRERYRSFRALWEEQQAAGIRADLAHLAGMPDAETGPAA